MKSLARPFNQNKIANIIHYIENNLENELSVKKLAELSCNAYDRFHHVFSDVAGEPVHQHIKRVRMERAAFLLRYTDFSIGDVAFLVGFGSNASFSKAFNNHFIQNPQFFRKIKKINIETSPNTYLLNYDEPQVRRETEREMIFFRTYQLMEIPQTWQKLFALQKTIELITGKPFTIFSHSAPELIFKTPDYPDITALHLCRWDVGITADEKVLKDFINLDEDELLKKQTLPTGKYAVYVHKGPAIQIMNSYDQILHRGLHEAGFKLAHSFTYHKYLRVGLQDDESLVELYFPITNV